HRHLHSFPTRRSSDLSALDQDIGLGAHNEEGRAKREDVEALEIHVAAIHDIERSGLRRNLVEDVDVMHFAAGNADKRGDIAMQRSEEHTSELQSPCNL